MSQYRRTFQSGGMFFFTLVTYKRRPFLTSGLGIDIIKQSWRDVQRKMPFALDAVCLLPDHMHLLITLPNGDPDYSMRIKMLKSVFTIKFLKAGGQDGIRNGSRLEKGEAAIWQRRFWEHTIRDEIDYESHFHYIHYNPVHHTLVQKVSDWRWSSFHRYVEEGMYSETWGSAIDPTGWNVSRVE